MNKITSKPSFQRTFPSDGEFQELADFAPVMIWRAGLDKLCNWFNKPWLDFVGRVMEQEVGYGWAEGVHPEDFDRCVEIYTASFEVRKPFSMEYRLRRSDGEYRWLLDNGAPFFRNGEFAGYFGSCVDVTAQKELEQRQQLLIHELNHRVKNTLATVQAIAAQSFRGKSERAGQDAFSTRLIALANAHDVLTRENWQGAELGAVVAESVRPHEDGRVKVLGPSVRLCPPMALHLSMALHELCTNACRHGALSCSEGMVTVAWTVTSASGAQLQLRWEESGGPVVVAPASNGFGTRLIAQHLGRTLRGTVALKFPASGVTCEINVPLPVGNPDDSPLAEERL